MDLDVLSRFLLISLGVNYAILLAWFLAFVFARRAMQSFHGRWFTLTDSRFDAIHYGAMAGYKLAILFFNLVPLVALSLARGAG